MAENRNELNLVLKFESPNTRPTLGSVFQKMDFPSLFSQSASTIWVGMMCKEELSNHGFRVFTHGSCGCKLRVLIDSCGSKLYTAQMFIWMNFKFIQLNKYFVFESYSTFLLICMQKSYSDFFLS